MTLPPRKSVCILSTGGTIAMHKTRAGYAPEVGHLQKSMTKIPELMNTDFPSYSIHEYDPPLDSANMTLENWHKIGTDILKLAPDFDGFVVLHGTDTMAYTASALSFMLENLNKPVILTGSQLPLFETRNDARENLINAVLIAGRYRIPEVCIYFNNKLFRGNRSVKMDASSFDAFASPNFPRLGKVGTEILIRQDLLLPKLNHVFALQTLQPFPITIIKIFPGMTFDLLEAVFQLPLKAVILQTYGLGNAPEDSNFIRILHEAIQREIILVNCSQCSYAKVRMHQYATGAMLLNTGVISGGDMTVEATLTKLFYLFSKKLSLGKIKTQITHNLRGELTI